MNNHDVEGLKIDKSILEVFRLAKFMSDGAYVTDKNGTVLLVNDGYSRITGLNKDEVIGKNIQEVIDDKYSKGEYVAIEDKIIADIDKKKVNDVYITLKPISVPKMVLEQKKDISIMGNINVSGERKRVLLVGKQYFDKYGNLDYILIIMRELNNILKLEKKLEIAESKYNKCFKELMMLKEKGYNYEFIGNDIATEKIREIIYQVAKTDATVIISGETGCGKEVVAREIFINSNRSTKPYIKINCAAIPEELLESELFGYEKGSFTGALNKQKIGYFEAADGGTLLLDEIGEMPFKLQTKLLRVLQEREITRIGGVMPIKVDVRIIAATNENLENQISKGLFRQDLFYRLNVIPIKILPLRDRVNDITVLAYHFLAKFNKQYKKNVEFDLTAIQVLEAYYWPGNVRELENIIERLIIMCSNPLINKDDVMRVIGIYKLNENIEFNEEIKLKDAVDSLEKSILTRVLNKYKSSYKAAEVLGITQPTVIRKAKALGIDKW